MSDTIFGKILDGEIPCHRIYEDEGRSRDGWFTGRGCRGRNMVTS